jgi:hypothetical protein
VSTSLALAAACLGLALGAEIRLPPWPLSPDGELVAVEPPGATLRAEGARVEAAGDGLWRVEPEAGAREVRFAAGGASAVAPVEPPPGRVLVRADPARPVKGRDAEVSLAIEVQDAAGRPDPEAPPPVLACSAGSVEDLASAGPARFTARYRPSPARHPEVAVITAISPRCPLCPTPRAVGAAALPISARTEVPGRTQPRVKVTVEVAGRVFGPVEADAEGRFQVAVEVPPGERLGRGVSLDGLGNRRAEALDLKLPPVRQLACAAWPPALPADGRSEAGIWCLATDPRGRPAARPRLALEARLGRVTALEPAGDGLQRARYTAPRGGGGGADRLVASWPAAGTASTLELPVGLATGAPASLGWSLEREPVAPGEVVAARTWARDERGDALPAPAGPPDAAEGFVAGGRFVARAGAGDWVQRAELRMELAPTSTAAALWLGRDGGEWVATARDVDGRPAAGVPVRFGSGEVVATDARGVARAQARGDAETVRVPGGARAAAWAGHEVRAPPASLSVVVEVPLAPEAPVDVRAAAENGLLRWRVAGRDGRPLAGRAVRLLASGPTLGPAEPDGDGGRCRLEGRGTVSVVDVATGVAAVVEVR